MTLPVSHLVKPYPYEAQSISETKEPSWHAVMAPNAVCRSMKGRLAGWDSKPVGFVRCDLSLKLQEPLWQCYLNRGLTLTLTLTLTLQEPLWQCYLNDAPKDLYPQHHRDGEPFQKTIFKRNIQKLRHLLGAPFKSAKSAYEELASWRRPFRSSAAIVAWYYLWILAPAWVIPLCMVTVVLLVARELRHGRKVIVVEAKRRNLIEKVNLTLTLTLTLTLPLTLTLTLIGGEAQKSYRESEPYLDLHGISRSHSALHWSSSLLLGEGV